MSVGGYFELELQNNEHFHKDAYRLNSARNCLEFILICRHWRKVYLPYYSCCAILQPFLRQKVEFEFYRINKSLDPFDLPVLKHDEAFLYTNYFGIKQGTVKRLADFYGKQLIVDNAQAFFAPRIEGIDTFYSPRKFFGVPDGGYLYQNDPLIQPLEQDDSSWSRALHLLRRIDQGPEMGYSGFRKAEYSLDYAPIKKMSKLTERILGSIDYSSIVLKRNRNYQIINEALRDQNLMCFDLQHDEVPMVYPFLSTHGEQIREALLSDRIYLAKYWNNVKERCSSGLEFSFVDNLLPIPIDQRLSAVELSHIIEVIQQYE